jgi:hypothetical protein
MVSAASPEGDMGGQSVPPSKKQFLLASVITVGGQIEGNISHLWADVPPIFDIC